MKTEQEIRARIKELEADIVHSAGCWRRGKMSEPSKAERYKQACEAMTKADEDRPRLELAAHAADRRAHYAVTKEGGLCHNGAILQPSDVQQLIAFLRQTFEPPRAEEPAIPADVVPLFGQIELVVTHDV